ncbi:MAG: hypothetical protein WBA74_05175 [Cyclobacteriaceae bacterium]
MNELYLNHEPITDENKKIFQDNLNTINILCDCLRDIDKTNNWQSIMGKYVHDYIPKIFQSLNKENINRLIISTCNIQEGNVIHNYLLNKDYKILYEEKIINIMFEKGKLRRKIGVCEPDMIFCLHSGKKIPVEIKSHMLYNRENFDYIYDPTPENEDQLTNYMSLLDADYGILFYVVMKKEKDGTVKINLTSNVYELK